MIKSINGMAERLREDLNAPGFIEIPGCYDVLSAMILEQSGFSTIFLSGYGVAASMLGNPDIGLTTLLETSLITKSVTRAVSVPVIVDADNGYGNEDNVVRTVNELEAAGAAAMVLEDQVLPKRCGHTAGKEILPLPTYMRKLECALNARQTPMCIVGRTDAMDLDEGIKRAKTFYAAGADILLIDGLKSVDAMKRVADEVPGHKQVNLIYGGVTPIFPAQELHQLGFKVIQYSTPALYIAAEALWRWLPVLHKTKDLGELSEMSTTFQEFQKFMQDCYATRMPQASKLRAIA
jgi:2-methylisocitrate lyase-like PEP mutase family enzyme